MKPLRLVQLEFDGQSAGAGFGELRAALPSVPADVADPVRLNTAADTFTAMSLRTDRLLETVTIPPGSPVVVQAYCTGMSMGLSAAGRLRQAGYDVRLLQLFNPEAVGYEHLEAAFAELADRLGAGAEKSRQQVRRAVDTNQDAAALLATMRAALLDHGAAFARGLGVPDQVAATFSLELINRYCAWLNFLLSSSCPQYSSGPAVLVYLTRQCPAVEDLRGTASALEVRRFAAADDALLSPEVLQSAVADLHLQGGNCP